MTEQMKSSGIDWIGDIPESWSIKRIKYCTDIIMGQSPDSNLIKEDNGIYPFMQGNAEFTNLYPKPSLYCDFPNKVSRVGDILMSVRAPVGELNISDREYGIGRGLCSIRPAYFNTKYFWYFMLKSKGDFSVFSNGSTFEAITTENLLNFPCVVPGIQEQQAIADFLDKECAQIDSIAADLEKQIALLQQYKKSLITETVTKGLDKSVPMKDSGVEWIGEIPEHWEISRVRHLASLCSGATPSKDVLSYWEGNIPWVSSQEVKSDIIKDTSLHISEEAINSCSTQLMPAGTLVMVVRSGILQHTIPVALLGVPATINQDIKAFQFNHLMLPAYFKYYIQGENDALLSVIIKDKTTVESVDNQLLLSLKIMVPPIEEQKAIVAFLNYKCGYIDKILNDKQEQLNLLMQHKKSLIYEYVTGKKRVKEVQ